MNRKIVLAIIAAGLISFIVQQWFFKKEGPDFSLVEVVRGNVIEEVSETGQVQMGNSIGLNFKNAGTIEKIYVKVGDKVWPGANLAKLNTNQLLIERNESQANLEISQAKLNQLLSGATPEAIQVAQTAVDNAQIALDDARRDYDEDLAEAYEDASNALDNAYLKGAGALTILTSIRKTYFNGNDQESITVKAKEGNIGVLLNQAKETIDNKDTDTALALMKSSLNDIYNDLNVVRDMTEVGTYSGIVSSANKTSLDTERLNVNTTLTNITNAQQTIASTKITGTADINTAQGALKKAQDELNMKIAKPSQTDIDLYQAQVKQAQAQLDLLENQIWESVLRSPVQGQITQINKEIGEIVQPSFTEPIIVLLPQSPYKIEADIYEEDIVKVGLGNKVVISFVALPGKNFQGSVVSINPAEELVNDIVYYQVTVNLQEAPQGVKPGMTADLSIQTALKENVLIIPEDAIEEKDGKYFVQVLKNKDITEREIKIGLRGSDNMVEVIAGLAEGERVLNK